MLSEKAKDIGNQSAIPVPLVSHCERLESSWDTGLTKRQWLIGMAMQGILANHTLNANETRIANYAILQADALLEVLAAEGSK